MTELLALRTQVNQTDQETLDTVNDINVTLDRLLT